MMGVLLVGAAVSVFGGTAMVYVAALNEPGAREHGLFELGTLLALTGIASAVIAARLVRRHVRREPIVAVSARRIYFNTSLVWNDGWVDWDDIGEVASPAAGSPFGFLAVRLMDPRHFIRRYNVLGKLQWLARKLTLRGADFGINCAIARVDHGELRQRMEEFRAINADRAARDGAPDPRWLSR